MKGETSNTLQAFWIAAGNLSSFTLAIVSAAILSRYFDKTEYGTYKQIIYVYNTLLLVFAFGLPQVFGYFLPRYGLSQGKEIVFKISRVLFLAGFVFSAFLFTFSGLIADLLKNPELSRGLKYFSPVPMLLLPTLGIEGIFSTYKKTIYIAIYDTLSRALMLAFIVLPVILFSRTYIMAIYGWIVSSFLILLMAYFFKGIPFKNVSQEKSGLRFKEIFAYSIPLVYASIAGIVYRSANQFYISRFFGPETFAEFSNGFIEIPFVQMILGATATVLMPSFAKIIHEKSDVSQITVLWQSALKKSAILIYPIVIFFLFYSKDLVIFVYSKTYSASAKYFSTAMVMNFFTLFVLAPLILAMGGSKFYAWLHVGMAIAAWIVEYIAILIFNTPMSVAVSFVIITILSTFVPLIYISTMLKIPLLDLLPVGNILLIALHSFISLFPVWFLLKKFLPEINGIFYVFIAGPIYLLVLFATSSLAKINYLEIVSPLLQPVMNFFNSRKDNSADL